MKTPPTIISSKCNFYGVEFVEYFIFKNGHRVPIYDVSSVSGLNQLIGYAKFINRDYGDVYYRGVNKIYDNVLPSIMRKRKSGKASDLTELVNALYSDSQFRESLKLSLPEFRKGEHGRMKNTINRNNKYIIEGVLQHYSGTTRFLDIVDNHWVSLWMGLYHYEELGKGNSYSRYSKREVPQIDYLEKLVNISLKGYHL